MYVSIVQDADCISEKEESQVEEVAEDHDVPPNIPPLPQSHLQRTQQQQSPEKSGSVAKIISQFREASNVIQLLMFANQ